ncbi:hypothetical protein A8F94_00770 [Bacillus sp. FJAT-27225]|uniref:TIGR04104 family putative zinc finger protein n=1 Tax=Bacillus sp. FJAT-27225 TaxID=1743144 RepID=UPI00080C3081|nr:hypothetical protein A8F94_00770 [Bacillus sp. FJAT-27225]
MPNCENCNSRFSWSKISRSIGWLYKPIACDNCGTKHKITLFSRCLVVALSSFPILIFVYFFSSYNNDNINIGIALLIAMVIILFAPYVVQYKKEL